MKAAIILSLFLANSVAGQVTCPGLYISVGDSCYTFSDNLYNWHDASLFCSFSGGYLAKIDSTAEQTYLKVYYDVYLTGTGHHWIGATDSLSEGTWRWVPAGQAVIFENWASGNPTTTNSVYDCAFWEPSTNFWQNVDCCSAVKRPLCEADPVAVVHLSQ